LIEFVADGSHCWQLVMSVILLFEQTPVNLCGSERGIKLCRTKGWIALAHRFDNLLDIVKKIRQFLFDSMPPASAKIIHAVDTGG
jgi:hypothetical protein